jgi:hypothetical protein
LNHPECDSFRAARTDPWHPMELPDQLLQWRWIFYFPHRTFLTTNAREGKRNKSNRRLTQIYADGFFENRLRDFTTLYLRAFAFICGLPILRVRSRLLRNVLRPPGLPSSDRFKL